MGLGAGEGSLIVPLKTPFWLLAYVIWKPRVTNDGPPLMPTEITVLLLAVLLAPIHIALYAVPSWQALGAKYLMSPRDEAKELPILAGRAKRAYYNFLESLPWFAIAVFAAVITDRTSDTTALLAWVYLVSRVVYIPAYILAIPYLRPTAWAFATGSIFAIIISVLMG